MNKSVCKNIVKRKELFLKGVYYKKNQEQNEEGDSKCK